MSCDSLKPTWVPAHQGCLRKGGNIPATAESWHSPWMCLTPCKHLGRLFRGRITELHCSSPTSSPPLGAVVRRTEGGLTLTGSIGQMCAGDGGLWCRVPMRGDPTKPENCAPWRHGLDPGDKTHPWDGCWCKRFGESAYNDLNFIGYKKTGRLKNQDRSLFGARKPSM